MIKWFARFLCTVTAFDDCIVLVGAYAAGMMDSYYIPVDRGQQMYGLVREIIMLPL